ncbi:MAG: hypothetical protein AAF869_03555 [Pseudomonadota bacterium]
MSTLVLDLALRLKKSRAKPLLSRDVLHTFFDKISQLSPDQKAAIIDQVFSAPKNKVKRETHPLTRDFTRAQELVGLPRKQFVEDLSTAVVAEFQAAEPIPKSKKTMPGFFDHFSGLPQSELSEFIVKYGLENASTRY